MKKVHFFEEIKEILLLEENIKVKEETPVEVDSMASLLLIAFLDENFSKTISQEKIKKIKNIADIIDIVGESNLK